MEFKIEEISGIGSYKKQDLAEKTGRKNEQGQVYLTENGRVFLVTRAQTIEVRSDANLCKNLREKYESVMESRYFGNRGIEIVKSGQIELNELYDLVRLSYNLTVEV